MGKFIICLTCFDDAYEAHSGSDDTGEYIFYECENCGAGYNVYDMALESLALSDIWDTNERSIIVDDSNPYYRQYWT